MRTFKKIQLLFIFQWNHFTTQILTPERQPQTQSTRVATSLSPRKRLHLSSLLSIRRDDAEQFREDIIPEFAFLCCIAGDLCHARYARSSPHCWPVVSRTARADARSRSPSHEFEAPACAQIVHLFDTNRELRDGRISRLRRELFVVQLRCYRCQLQSSLWTKQNVPPTHSACLYPRDDVWIRKKPPFLYRLEQKPGLPILHLYG